MANLWGYTIMMAPPLGLSTPRALKVNMKKKLLGCEIDVFLSDLHHILNARSCNHFLWFPHARRLPRPQKHPKNFNLFFAFYQLLFFWPTNSVPNAWNMFFRTPETCSFVRTPAALKLAQAEASIHEHTHAPKKEHVSRCSKKYSRPRQGGSPKRRFAAEFRILNFGIKLILVSSKIKNSTAAAVGF